MGLDKFISTRVYICYSDKLEKRWIVKAENTEDAAGKVTSFCKQELKRLEELNNGKDVDVDLKFEEVKVNVKEI